MRIVDANIILRYLLNDSPALSSEASRIIDVEAFIPNEVLAEVVYVLEKVYHISRTEIRLILLRLTELPTISTVNVSVVHTALKFYADAGIDFVDALLAGYSTQPDVEIATFDKKLKKVIASIARNT